MTRVTPPAAPRITLAAIAGAHGVTGEVRLKLFAESLDSLKRHKAFEAGGRALTLKALRDGPNGPIARFAEVIDRNTAEALRGTTLSVERSALPPLGPGEYYYADLIGLEVVSDKGPVGRVTAVENYGAGDLLDIALNGGGSVMVPVSQAEIGDVARIAPEWLA
jgi:16S rRNA processing protein RimM